MTEGFSTSDSTIQTLLARLRSPEGEEAFEQFLKMFSPAILQLARQFTNDPNQLNDCYLFISEKLSDKNFHRLVSYKPEGSASFRSWFKVVVVNLCIDWQRHLRGRPRLFKSILKLSNFEQSVFKYRFQQRLSLNACYETLRGNFPDLNELQLAGAVARINQILTPEQINALIAQQSKSVSLDEHQSTSNANELHARGPSPEATAELFEDQDRLQQALAKLSPHQRLLIKLRYQQELSLKEVARLTRLGDPFRARRHIQAALKQLSEHFKN